MLTGSGGMKECQRRVAASCYVVASAYPKGLGTRPPQQAWSHGAATRILNVNE